MIDFRKERVFPLSRAPRKTPTRRSGKRIHVATFHRWATVGCRGVKLETLQIGGTRRTSQEALQRFFETLSGPQTGSRRDQAHDQSYERFGERQQSETDQILDQLGL